MNTFEYIFSPTLLIVVTLGKFNIYTLRLCLEVYLNVNTSYLKNILWIFCPCHNSSIFVVFPSYSFINNIRYVIFR